MSSGAELTPGNSPAWLPPPGAAQIARSDSVNVNVNVEGHTSIFTFLDLPHGFEREEIKAWNLDQAIGRAGFMTGLYMGRRLDTVGTEDSAQIMRSVFHMALLVLIILFPSANTPSLLGIFCCSLVFSLPAGLSTPGRSFPTSSPDTTCRPDRTEVFSPCHQKKRTSWAASSGVFVLWKQFELGTMSFVFSELAHYRYLISLFSEWMNVFHVLWHFRFLSLTLCTTWTLYHILSKHFLFLLPGILLDATSSSSFPHIPD